MSIFNDTNYNPNGSDSNSDSNSGGGYKERETILMDNYCIVSFDIAGVGVVDQNWGRQFILKTDNMVLHEGVLTERQSDGRTKLFDWGNWYERDEDMSLVPVDEGGGITLDVLGRFKTTTAGSNEYKYEILDGVLEGGDDVHELGDVELWNGNSKKVRTLAKLLSEYGHDIINEDEKKDDHDWLQARDEEEFRLREELEGRRVMMWFKKVTLSPEENDAIDEEVTFSDTVMLDETTQAGITINNSVVEDEDSGSEMESQVEAQSPAAAAREARQEEEEEEAEFHPDVDDLIDTFAGSNTNVNSESTKASVRNVIVDTVDETDEVNMDRVFEEIEARQ